MVHFLSRYRRFVPCIPPNARITRHRSLLYSLICILGLIILAVLYRYNPSDYVWMPKCPTKLLFNIDCPGCGFQRAIHAILHGEIKKAFALNPFLFLAAPYAILAIACEFITNLKIKKRLSDIAESKYMRYGYVILFFIWFVIRNMK